MPLEAETRKLWMDILKGHTLGSSNFLCVDHFHENQLKKAGSKFALVNGGVPDPNLLPREPREISVPHTSGTNTNEEIAVPSTSSMGLISNEESDLHIIDESPDPDHVRESDECVRSPIDHNQCENCAILQEKVNNLEKELIAVKANFSVKQSELEHKLVLQTNKSKKYFDEKRSLKSTISYHKTHEAKMKSIINTLKDKNLLSSEAANDLNVMLTGFYNTF